MKKLILLLTFAGLVTHAAEFKLLTAGDTITLDPASETVAGAAEIATQAEVDAGADAVRYVTPATLANTPVISAGVTNAVDTIYDGATTVSAISQLNFSGATVSSGGTGTGLVTVAAGDAYLSSNQTFSGINTFSYPTLFVEDRITFKDSTGDIDIDSTVEGIIEIGYGANAGNTIYGTAVGNGSNGKAANAAVFGHDCEGKSGTGPFTLFGHVCWGYGQDITGIGKQSTFGQVNSSNSDRVIGMGNNSTVYGDDTYGLGHFFDIPAGVLRSGGIGNSIDIDGNDSTAHGHGIQISAAADQANVIGANSGATHPDSNTIGYNMDSVTNHTTVAGSNGRVHFEAGSDANTNSYVDVDKVILGVTTVTATTATAGQDAYILVDDDTAGSAVTITLPAVSGLAGTQYKIKKLGTTANVIVDGNGSETIDGGLTATITTQYETITVICDGTEWFLF